MSDDMKVIIEGWRKTLKEYTPDHAGRKEKILAPLKQKYQDKRDSAFAQAVASAMGNKGGKVYPGTHQGREDVLDAVEGGYEKVKDFQTAMSLLNMIPGVNIKKPEDIPRQIIPVLIQLVLVRVAIGKLKAINAEARLIERFPYYRDIIKNMFRKKVGLPTTFVLAKKLPVLEFSIYGILAGALQLFGDDFLIWFLGSAMAADPERGDKK